MSDKAFKIKLNDELIEYFNETVSEHDHLSLQKTFEGKRYKGVNAWDCICSCMDRIRCTVHYLNDMELTMSNRYGNAFNFMEFMNNSAVIIDAVDMLADIFSVSFTDEDAECRIFNQPGNDGKGTDKNYFKYLRSLCVVHPTNTSYHKSYQQDHDFLTCPYIRWNTGLFAVMVHDGADLHAKVYDNEPNSIGDHIPIYMAQIFDFVKYRYGLITKVAGGIRRYHSEVISELRGTPVPERRDDESEAEYFLRLQKEHVERFGGGYDYIYDYACKILEFVPTNPANSDAVARYQNAWRLAMGFELNALRNVSYEGFENSGVVGTDEDSEAALISKLYYSHSECPELKELSYELSKLHYLDGTYGPSDSHWGRMMLQELLPVFSKYIEFDPGLKDWELYVLSNIALYEIALDHPSVLNDSIPWDSRYRKLDNFQEGQVPDA